MITLDLEWYKDHPYVQEWRNQDQNSFFPAVQSLNQKLNTNPNNPITVSRVANIVGDYLTLLVRTIRHTCTTEKLPRSRKTVAERFQLNRTEEQFVINNLKSLKQ